MPAQDRDPSPPLRSAAPSRRGGAHHAYASVGLARVRGDRANSAARGATGSAVGDTRCARGSLCSVRPIALRQGARVHALLTVVNGRGRVAAAGLVTELATSCDVGPTAFGAGLYRGGAARELVLQSGRA